jgi:hypothetical protein
LAAVYAAAAPLDRRQQNAFVQACVAALARYTEPGPGDVNRVIREHQRAYRDPPALGGTPASRRPPSKLASKAPVWASQ